MGKLQSDHKLFVQPVLLDPYDTPPPQIPPRMKKKKGPALPEKPPHIRAKSSDPSASSQTTPTPREPLRPKILNLDRPPQREVLVAASSKSGRERPAEKRQREPAKLLMPTSTGKMPSLPIHPPDASKKELAVVQSKALARLEEILPSSKKETTSKNPLWSLERSTRRCRPLQQQPLLLIPRNLLTWGSAAAPPLSYALWSQRDSGRAGVVRPAIRQPQAVRSETSATSAVRLRSNSVTRSGSLTSQGSSSSDSGGETFPKSVLKKQHRRSTAATHGPSAAKGGGNNHNNNHNRRVDQKKNVTFNAFATVQLMEE